MNANTATYVGMDVHKATISFAVRYPDGTEAEGQTANNPTSVHRLLRQVGAKAPDGVLACYEAGATGFVLQRQCESEGVVCDVIAPSLIPQKAGDRVKTDKRDARKLLELFRAGLLTPVHVPTPGQEAARNIVRRLGAAKVAARRAQHELQGLLLCLGVQVVGKRWTKAHRLELSRLKLQEPDNQVALEDGLLSPAQAEERVRLLEKHVLRLASSAELAPVVNVLQCFKGIATLTAVRLAVELPTPERFASARHLMSFVGLVCREDSSGATRRRGSITKAGNITLRTALVEAAVHAVHGVTQESKPAARRRKGQPAWAVQLAKKAERRMHARYWALTHAGKHHNVAVTAVARELCGFIWAAMIRANQETRTVQIDAEGVVVNG